MKLKAIISVFLLLVLTFVGVDASGYDPDMSAAVLDAMTVSAESCVVYSLDRNEVIYGLNETNKLPMASTTKIMTAVIVLENCDILDTVRIPSEAVGVEGSSAYLMDKEKISVEDLLYALMLESANDSAVALAVHTAGDTESFVALMNDKASQLGMDNTHFTNPHGLNDENHYSTAYDMALLFDYAMSNEAFAAITGSYRYETEKRLFVNHNRLLKTCDGAIGGKTGYTKLSGRCLVSAASRNGVDICVVTLNDPDDWRDHARLYDAAFEAYERRDVAGGDYTIPVVGGVADSVSAEVEDMSFVVEKSNGDIRTTVCYDRFLYAPVKKGECAGYVVYSDDSGELGRSELFVTTDVAKVKEKSILEKIISFILRN